MSFRYAVGDFINAGQLALVLYYKFFLVIQDAPREFRDLVDSLRSVRIAMHDLEEEVKNENSALSRAGEDRIRNVVAVVGAITRTLKAVEKIANRYQVIVGPATDLASYGFRLWSKIRWTQEVKEIEDLKQKLMFHTGTITLVLLTVGNASLSRMETIMNTLVMSIPPSITQLNSITDGPEDRSLHPTSNEVAVSSRDGDESETEKWLRSQGSDGLHESQSYPQSDLSAELPDGPLHITADETVAVQEIFAEAERKFVKHGKHAPSRASTIGRRRNSPVRIVRKPVPIPHITDRNRSTARFSVPVIESPKWTYTSDPDVKPRFPPVPAKIPLNPPPPVGNQDFSQLGTLGSSINYKPSPAIVKVLFHYKIRYLEKRSWPYDFKLLLRIAEWWFLKGELSSRENKRLTDQAYIDFVKCSWILGDIIKHDSNGFSYNMPGEDMSHYYGLLKRLERNYTQQNPNTLIPTSNFDTYRLDLRFLELTQPEEHSGVFTSPHHLYLDTFNHVDLENEKILFQSFVALDFGLSRPSQPPVEMARSYLLSLYFSSKSRTAWIYISNQTGSLGIVKSTDKRNIGPEMDGSNMGDWVCLEFNGMFVYAGFSSAEAAASYAFEFNYIRREMLERPACLFEVGVERAQYMPRGLGVNPMGVGPGSLALMEMMRAEDDRSRYREIVMPGHFVTQEIPLHVIKIIQSSGSPVRVQLWWPTFNTPCEDLRNYLRQQLGITVLAQGKIATDEFFLNPHMRKSGASISISTSIAGIFVEIRYRTIEERLLDIDLGMRSDRMLDVVFRTPRDASEFITHAGGTAPGDTERLAFQKVTKEKEIRLFWRVDETIRFSYKESDTYCNFIVDRSSTYKITPEGSMSLWSILWSPSRNVQRSNHSYLTDSVDLGVFDTAERDDFIAALDFPEQNMPCASMKIKNFVGVRAGVAGKFAKALNNPRSSAAEAMLVLRMVEDVLHVTVFGEIDYAEYSRHGENLRLTAKVVTYVEKLGGGDREPKLSIRLSVREAALHSFNRERSIMVAARKRDVVAAEVGGMSFIVNDVSEWRAAVTKLGIEDMAPTNFLAKSAYS